MSIKSTVTVSAMLALAANAQASIPIPKRLVDESKSVVTPKAPNLSQKGLEFKLDKDKTILANWGGQCGYFLNTGATPEMLVMLGCN